MPLMSHRPDPSVRRAGPDDADVVGRLLHDFNTEFEDITPGPTALAERFRELLAAGEITVLLVERGRSEPKGLAVMRFYPSIWTRGLECHLAELYVIPDRRGEGLGRALMEEAIELARREGADYVDLGTSEDDVAARALYESLGFTNRERLPDGPTMYVYEREL